MSKKEAREFKAISPDTLKVVEFEVLMPKNLEELIKKQKELKAGQQKEWQYPPGPKEQIIIGLKKIFAPIAEHSMISLVTAIIVVIAILGIIYAPVVKMAVKEVILTVIQEKQDVEKIKKETKETKEFVEQKIKDLEKASEAGKVKEQKELDEAMLQALKEQEEKKEEERKKENIEKFYKLGTEIGKIRKEACIENQMQSGKTASAAEKICEKYIQQLYQSGGVK